MSCLPQTSGREGGKHVGRSMYCNK